MSVQIVTDSTSDIPPAVAEELGIRVVPLTVFFGESAYRDRVDLDSDRFFELLRTSPHHPRTSAPAVGDFQAAYEELLARGPVLSIHLSSKFSGTLNSAHAAKTALGSPGQLMIIDGMTASLALGLIVMAAARAAQAGADLDGCTDAARRVMASNKLYFVVDTLEYLRRGGRIGRAQALVGGLLSIKPILTVADGLVTPFEKVRTRARAVARLHELLDTARNVTEIAVLHSTAPAEAAELESFARKRWPEARLISGRLGPVIGTYTGPGVLGFCMVEDV